jgi:hypothetical protein
MRALLQGFACALLMAAASAHAAPAQEWLAAPDEVLARLRGGFALPDLVVSFGIVRTVNIDGQTVVRTALNIPDVRNITTDQARQLAQQAGTLTIVQNGVGNTAGIPLGGVPGIVIQNTQDNRQLQAITEITATTNGMRLLQSMNLNQTLADALKGALGRP